MNFNMGKIYLFSSKYTYSAILNFNGGWFNKTLTKSKMSTLKRKVSVILQLVNNDIDSKKLVGPGRPYTSTPFPCFKECQQFFSYNGMHKSCLIQISYSMKWSLV